MGRFAVALFANKLQDRQSVDQERVELGDIDISQRHSLSNREFTEGISPQIQMSKWKWRRSHRSRHQQSKRRLTNGSDVFVQRVTWCCVGAIVVKMAIRVNWRASMGPLSTASAHDCRL